MDETTVSSDIENDSGVSQDMLPATPEIIREGVSGFESVYNALPDNLKDYFLRVQRFREVFIGLAPQAFLEGENAPSSPEKFEEMKQVIDKVSPQIRAYYSPVRAHSATEHGRPSLINLNAARQVAAQNPRYFPSEAVADIEKWLFEDTSQWHGEADDVQIIRFGLLSGFPVGSTEKHCDFVHLNKRLKLKDSFALSDYLGSTRDTKDTIRIESMLKKAAPDIPVDTISGILNSQTSPSRRLQFVNYEGKRDAEYVKRWDQAYEESGIDAVATKLNPDITPNVSPKNAQTVIPRQLRKPSTWIGPKVIPAR